MNTFVYKPQQRVWYIYNNPTDRELRIDAVDKELKAKKLAKLGILIL